MSSEKRSYELKARAERQRETRERIAGAAADLHMTEGVGRTTVAEIARHAGVQRLTVYNHFADLGELLPACSAHYLARHPPPDLEEAFAREDPVDRVRAVLAAFYGWYRETAPMMRNVHGERGAVSELEEWMAKTVDVTLAELADGLAAGFPASRARAHRPRALIRLALEFWTWHRLSQDGLDDEAAADLMASTIQAPPDL